MEARGRCCVRREEGNAHLLLEQKEGAVGHSKEHLTTEQLSVGRVNE